MSVDLLGPVVPKVPMVIPAVQESQVCLVPEDLLDVQVMLVPKEKLDLLELQVRTVAPAHLAHREPVVSPESWDSRGQREQLASLARLVRRDFSALLA